MAILYIGRPIPCNDDNKAKRTARHRPRVFSEKYIRAAGTSPHALPLNSKPERINEALANSSLYRPYRYTCRILENFRNESIHLLKRFPLRISRTSGQPEDDLTRQLEA